MATVIESAVVLLRSVCLKDGHIRRATLATRNRVWVNGRSVGQ